MNYRPTESSGIKRKHVKTRERNKQIEIKKNCDNHA